MSEKEKIHERKDFWRWIAILGIIGTILFGLGFCDAFYHPKNKIPNYLDQNGKENFKDDSGYNFSDDQESQDLIGDEEKKTSNFRIALPSNVFVIDKSMTPRQLCNRWHVSYEDLEKYNPNIDTSKPNTPIDKGEEVNVPPPSSMSDFEKSVVNLTNQERAKNGMPALKSDYAELSKSAIAKSKDMADRNYFAHQSPSYGSPFDMMRSFGVTYKSSGENIAKGQRTPQEVVQAWMNSSGHRANILNRNFTHIGVGFIKGQDEYLWTQQFVQK